MENTFPIKASSMDEAANKFQQLMDKEGYKLENGDKLKGEYGKGNKLMRILLGGFIDRFVFTFTISEENNGFNVLFQKHSVGNISGGMMGASKLDTEYKRILKILQEAL